MTKKFFKYIFILMLLCIIIGGGIFLYMWFTPHRDISQIESDYKVEASTLVNEYLADYDIANEKYLSEDGDSKIFDVKGKVYDKDVDMKNQVVLYLKDYNMKAAVSCTFTTKTNIQAEAVNIGDNITIKGEIKSGATYDEDLEFYEDVVLEKCSIINN